MKSLSLSELLVDKGARLEVLDGLLPRVFEDADRHVLLIIGAERLLVRLHEQDALELVVDRQVHRVLLSGGSTFNCSRLLALRQILLLAQLEIVEPGLSLELFAFEASRRVILHKFDLLWDWRVEIQGAAGVARVHQVL